MKVILNRKNESFHYEARNELGQTVDIDASPEIGGQNKGVRPMELLLMAAGGCSSIDLGLIMKKQKQDIADYSVEITADRKDDTGKAFSKIHFNFKLWGNAEEAKVERAVQLTFTKYCSVLLSLDPTIEITHNIEINSSAHEA